MSKYKEALVMLKVFQACIETGVMPGKDSMCAKRLHLMIYQLGRKKRVKRPFRRVGRNGRSGS